MSPSYRAQSGGARPLAITPRHVDYQISPRSVARSVYSSVREAHFSARSQQSPIRWALTKIKVWDRVQRRRAQIQFAATPVEAAMGCAVWPTAIFTVEIEQQS